LPAVVGQLVLADRSVAGQVSEQHNRAGALVHQKTDQVNEGVQVLHFGLGNTGWRQSRTHDPQTTIKPLWPIRISTIRGICWIAMSKLRVFPSRAAVCDKT